mgnify:CR=1 FL=1
MQVATAGTVRGSFTAGSAAGEPMAAPGVLSRFSTRAGRFFAEAEGPDGRRRDYEITHTLGVEPLQQYLVALPGGRLQALTTAWDIVQVAYFNGYARWTYLTTPFFMAMPGFHVTEIEPWKEGSEIWRGLRVRFPPSIASHSTEQARPRE